MLRYSFTGGRPDPDAFPVDGLIAAAAHILPQMGRSLTLYPGDLGYLPLREVASERFARREGKPLPIDHLGITSGSMQSIDLVCHALLEPGDTVITEELCYAGTLGCFRHHQAQIVGVPLDDRDGMDMDALEVTLNQLAGQGVKPKFLYTTDTHQNPTGAILSEPRRRRLLELADEHDLVIIEDDCYGDIDFEQGIVPPALAAMDTSERVIFIASFSKILGPGIRLGYFCAPQPYLSEILTHRWDLGTSALASAVVAEFFKHHLWDHIAKTNAIVKTKRDAMLAVFEERIGDVATWTKPRGGLFVWVRLPEAIDMDQLQQLANARGVEFSRGQAFHAEREDLPCIRLSFGYTDLDGIRNGTDLLCDCIHECL